MLTNNFTLKEIVTRYAILQRLSSSVQCEYRPAQRLYIGTPGRREYTGNSVTMETDSCSIQLIAG